MRRRLRFLAASLLVALPACRESTLTVVPRGELPAVYSSPSPTISPGPDLPATGTVYYVHDGLLLPVEDALPAAASIAHARVIALLDGVPEGVRARTHIPAETRLLDLGVVGGVATVDLSQEFRGGAAGRSLALRVAQVVYTLTEEPAIRTVVFTIEGIQTGVVADSGQILDRPVGRDDFVQFVCSEACESS